MNGGTCSIETGGKLGCICPSSYYGEYCENGMSTFLLLKAISELYIIFKQRMIYLQLLSLTDKCSPNGTYLCKNGGYCKIDMTSISPYCSCSKEYEGVHCETGRNNFCGISLFLNVFC